MGYKKLFSKIKKRSKKIGFTITELIVVVVVIFILVSISIIGFGRWKRTALIDQIKTELTVAASAMASSRNFNNTYPTDILNVTSYKPSATVAISGGSSDGDSYCIEAYSTELTDVLYHIDSFEGSQNITDGGCAKITKISSGATYNCFIDASNKAYCWGQGTDGLLGNGLTSTSPVAVAIDTSGVLAGKTLKSITSGDYFNCALASDNLVYCWGANWDGQLGNNQSDVSQPSPVAVNMTNGISALYGKTVKSISFGNYNMCTIASDSKAYCWGDDSFGQLGNGITGEWHAPIAASAGLLSGKTIKYIASGWSHSCAVTTDDKIYCWGITLNSYGVLGNGTTSDSITPVAVDMTGALSGKKIKAIEAGNYHTCVIASDNMVYCWGRNCNGELGNNASTDSPVPVKVNTDNGVSALYGKTVKALTADYYHTCAIGSDDKAYCWGDNWFGNVGDGTNSNNRLVPTAVSTSGALNGKTIKYISTGRYTSCAIASDDKAYCWGRNDYGQLGNNTMPTNSSVPVAVTMP